MKKVRKHTTNVSRPAIGARYGEAIRDRFADMFNTIVLDGPSRRG